MNDARNISALLFEICERLCPEPDQLEIQMAVDSEGVVSWDIGGPGTNMSRVIGKKGVTINAIRTIVHACCSRYGISTRIAVSVRD